MKKREVEILAPAGSFESMVAAVNAGADAVYIGGSRFGARAYADNLTEEDMVRAIGFVHIHGCKIYMTVNTLVKEKELSELYGYLKPYYEAGLDAVIVQDLGVFQYIRRTFPDLPIHVSTQMTVTGAYSTKQLKELGAARVVPARELSLEEIKEIAATGIEVETFVHGALCYCYSGQCLFSSLIGGRSGNRGRCAQPCRLPFDVMREGSYLNRKDEKYVLSLKDLSTLELLPKILEAGVCSLKIEGRMKSPRYTAGVVNIYRKYVDLYEKKGQAGYRVDKKDKEALLSLFDRGGQSEGYYETHNGRDMVVLKEKSAFREADQELYDYLDRTFVEAEKKEKITGTAYFAVGKPARLYLNYELLKGQREVFGCKEMEHKAVSACSLLVKKEGPVVEEAKNAPMDRERILKQLRKTGDSPYVFENLDVTVEGNVFLPVQTLNAMRREALEELKAAILEKYRRKPQILASVSSRTEIVAEEGGACAKRGECREAAEAAEIENPPADKTEFSALVNTEEQFAEVLSRFSAWRETKNAEGQRFSIYLASEEFDAGRWKELSGQCHKAGVFCYLMLPRIFRREAEQYFLKNMDTLKEAAFDALGAAAMEEPGFFRLHSPKLPLYFDQGMYGMNHLAEEALRNLGAARTTIPVELNEREIAEAGLAGEMIVYGYLPMMVSAQCIKKTSEGCTKKPELLYLKDRKGKKLSVRNQCRFCYNTIYNESPLSLHGLLENVKRLKPSAVRLNFTVETGKEAGEILESFWDEWSGRERRNAGEKSPVKEFTRGHFKRGVE